MQTSYGRHDHRRRHRQLREGKRLRWSEFCASCGDARRTSSNRSIFILPHGPPESYEGHEWFDALVVLVGLYFAVRNLMRARR